MIRESLIFSVRESGLQYQCPAVDPIAVPVPDTIRPTIAITAPTNGSVVSRTVTITAHATDNVAIASVQFIIDGSPLGAPVTGAGPSYSIPWNTLLVDEGPHEIIAIAKDTAGNQSVSAAVDVSVVNFVQIDNAQWLMPSPGGDFNSHGCADPSDVVIVLGGNSAVTYNVTLRIRGLVEWKDYSGGTQDSHFYTGGAGADPGSLGSNPLRNTYSLEVSLPAQHYFLNAYTSGTVDGVFVVDYNHVVQMKGGSTLTLKARSIDNLQFPNDTMKVVPVGPTDPAITLTQPFAGQFVQINIVSIT